MASSQSKTVKKLFHYLWRSYWFAPLYLSISLLSLVLAKLASLSVPLVYKMIIDQLNVGGDGFHLAFLLILGSGLVRFASVFFNELRDLVFVRIEQRSIRQINLGVFQHLHALSMRFHLNRKTGELSRVLERGTRAIESFFRYFVFNLFPTFLELFLIIVVLFVLYPWRFGVVILATLFLYVFFTFAISSWRIKFMRRMNDANNKLGTKVIDSLLNAATVKYFSNEAQEAQRYDHSLESYEKCAVYNKWSLSLLNFGQGVILTLGIVAIMLFALPQVRRGELTVGDFVLLYTYLLSVYTPLYILGFAYRELKQAFVDMDGLFSLADVEQDIKDVRGAKDLTFQGGKIAFKNVSFAYEAERPLLKNVTFTIKAGQTFAVVGASGSGKSTLVALLLRFFEPQKGTISIDDQPIHLARQHSLRGLLGVVPQDTVLFNDTLSYNIGYGRLDASFDEIEQASKRASLHRFVQKLPQQYKTRVGERGLKLSGGEKQRVGIARAILKDPKIFIFDEATSALDSTTERAIQTSLEKCSKGHTTFVIAHRLSTVVKADQILVLDEGTVVEQGTHQELLKKKGAYATLWAQQQEEESHP